MFPSWISFLSLVALSLAARILEAELAPIGYDLIPRAATSTTSSKATSTSLVPDQQCTNGPFTRACWGNGFSITTNYDSTWPNTGRTVAYSLEVTNTTMSLDGVPRIVMAVNGQYPGPTLIANWGDTLQITVKNSLQNNGTSMHWHGIRQWHTNQMDGTNGVTECPLAPGKSRTYTFLCTQFGTTWYHSHYSDQYSDGVVGTIIINGPATSNYDYDLGTMAITDWYYTPAFQLAPLIEHAVIRGPPPANNVLINGSNVNANGGGQYHRNTITKGKRYRVRFINTATNDGYKVSLDGHNFTVITADFVPIIPFTTQWLFINIGQRYDTIIYANQPVDSYWLHVVVQSPCGSNLNNNALAIFSYAGANNSIPTSGAGNLPPSTDCNDPNSQLTPYVKLSVPSQTTIPQSSDLDVGFAIVQDEQGQTLVQWNLNFTAIVVQWDKPTLQYVQEGNTSYPPAANIITLPDANTWSFWVIQAIATLAPPLPHPIHMHGHDFYVLGSGVGTFSDPSVLQYNNPPRRDVATLPASGWLVIAFITDNPGAWLLHCHIAWHVGLGLGAQFLEQPSNILSTLNLGGQWAQECADWDAYYKHPAYNQSDSGL